MTAAAGLVIFDCDGVLVDSEGISMRELARALAAVGGTLTEQEVAAEFVGISMASILERATAHLGHAPPGDWIDGFIATRAAAFDRELRAVPGAHDAVRSVRAQGYDLCIASGGTMAKMGQTLRLAGLHAEFAERCIFSATMVAHGKPAPDLFLHAAAACGFAPDACVVVEDSVPGVIAARAAAMRVLGFAPSGGDASGDGAHAERLAALGAEVFADMAELPARLAG
jgi:HAD superfamily hydrolase (TIGR01509 family)